MDILISIALGLSLAASCGLRAFLPLLVAGVAARLGEGWIPLSESFAWLQSTPALVALSVAVVAEVVADKVPAVDHLLDVVQAPVRTIAGMVVAAAVAGELPGWATALFAVVAGGGTALSVHATKSVVRVGSTAATAGVANPLLSLAEDFACLVASLLSVLLWFVAIAVAAAVVGFIAWAALRLLRRPGAAETLAEAP